MIWTVALSVSWTSSRNHVIWGGGFPMEEQDREMKSPSICEGLVSLVMTDILWGGTEREIRFLSPLKKTEQITP